MASTEFRIDLSLSQLYILIGNIKIKVTVFYEYAWWNTVAYIIGVTGSVILLAEMGLNGEQRALASLIEEIKFDSTYYTLR